MPGPVSSIYSRLLVRRCHNHILAQSSTKLCKGATYAYLRFLGRFLDWVTELSFALCHYNLRVYVRRVEGFNKSRSIRNSAPKKVGKRTLKQRIFIRSVVASQEPRHFCPRPHRLHSNGATSTKKYMSTWIPKQACVALHLHIVNP